MNFHHNVEFLSQRWLSPIWFIYLAMMNFIKMGNFHQMGDVHQNYDILSKLWLFISMMNLYYNEEITVKNFPPFVELASKLWSFITMMNFYHYFEFNYRAKFLPKSVLVPIEAELGLAQPQLVCTFWAFGAIFGVGLRFKNFFGTCLHRLTTFILEV